jgi:hypothetical protein
MSKREALSTMAIILVGCFAVCCKQPLEKSEVIVLGPPLADGARAQIEIASRLPLRDFRKRIIASSAELGKISAAITNHDLIHRSALQAYCRALLRSLGRESEVTRCEISRIPGNPVERSRILEELKRSPGNLGYTRK